MRKKQLRRLVKALRKIGFWDPQGAANLLIQTIQDEKKEATQRENQTEGRRLNDNTDPG